MDSLLPPSHLILISSTSQTVLDPVLIPSLTCLVGPSLSYFLYSYYTWVSKQVSKPRVFTTPANTIDTILQMHYYLSLASIMEGKLQGLQE